jgi:hypothetical protein
MESERPPRPASPTPAAAPSEPLLPETTSDERESWGERVISDDPDDLRRFLDEVPPHH